MTNSQTKIPSGSDLDAQSILAHQLRLCKAKWYKCKYIQKRSRDQLRSYKDRMLRLVRKKSADKIDEVQRKMTSVEEEIVNEFDQHAVAEHAITDFEQQVKSAEKEYSLEASRLVLNYLQLALRIEEENVIHQSCIQKAADRIQQICRETIKKTAKC